MNKKRGLAPTTFDRGYALALRDMARLLSNAEDNNAEKPKACRVYTYELRDQLIRLSEERTLSEGLLNPLVPAEDLQ